MVKGIHLEGLRVVGKPRELARKYYSEGADEIIFMDVVASLYGRNNILSDVRQAAEEIFIPLTVGGGIRSLDDIVEALRNGADKVAINTAATKNPALLKEASMAFGSQCIVLSVEAKRRGSYWEVLTDNGRETTGMDVLEWVVQAEELGVGEILITSVDQEGTRKGFDNELILAVSERVSLPVIACGGAGNGNHLTDLLDEAGVEAVCCASLFHYDIMSIPELKQELAKASVEVRL